MIENNKVNKTTLHELRGLPMTMTAIAITLVGELNWFRALGLLFLLLMAIYCFYRSSQLLKKLEETDK